MGWTPPRHAATPSSSISATRLVLVVLGRGELACDEPPGEGDCEPKLLAREVEFPEQLACELFERASRGPRALDEQLERSQHVLRPLARHAALVDRPREPVELQSLPQIPPSEWYPSSELL